MVTGMRRSESVIQPDLFQYHNHFEFLGLIGKTKFSEVFRVRHRQTKEIFAVKRSRRGFRTKLQRERCLREIKAVSALPAHPNIVGQYRAWQEGGHFYIQMDYCEGGSLNQILYPAAGPSPLTTDQLWTVAIQVASGLDFLHSYDVLHLDIKPENLYRNLDADGDPGPWRIGDFGLAVAKESKDWDEGDGDYVAPELLKNCEQPTPAADVFSLGATLYECATGEKLPRKESAADAAEVELPDRPESFVMMLRAMLLSDPNERPLAGQIVAYATAYLEEFEAMQGAANRTPEGAAVVHEGGNFSFALGAAGTGTTPSPLLVQANNNAEEVCDKINNTGGEPALRWVPSLSPLLSDGNLTPGAAAGLIGLTPPTAGAAATAATAAAANVSTATTTAAEQQQRPRPPPLTLPSDQQILNNNPQSSTNRTIDTSNPNSFRIHRRDLISPGRNGGGGNNSEFNMGSATESEPYSFSCDCDTGSASDLDFPDTITNAGGNGVGGIPFPNSRRLSGMSLAWEMYNSPDWQGRRPPSRSSTPPVKYNGTTVSLTGDAEEINEDNDQLDHPSLPSSAPNSIESSPSGSCPVSSRSCAAPGGAPSASPRFPPLDGLGVGNLNIQDVGPLSARDRVSAKSTPRYPSPFESSALAAAAQAALAAGNNTAVANINADASLEPPPFKKPLGGSSAVVPPLILPSLANNSLRRKRQHSSRRPLVHALKENGNGDLASACSVDLCSSRSLQELMPVRKGARRGGTFHPDGTLVDNANVAGGDEAQPISGQSTQRSARGPPSARLADLKLSATAGVVGAVGSGGVAGAADRMNTMTLNDISKNNNINA
jgi:serine/threonine protein kinase